MRNLAALLAKDLSKTPPEELAQGVQDAEHTADQAAEWSGRLIAALNRQGKTWSQIAEMTGVKQTTAFRRAQPYI